MMQFSPLVFAVCSFIFVMSKTINLKHVIQCASINVGANVSVNLNELEQKILEMVLDEPTLSAKKISLKINKSKRTVERYLKALQEKEYIVSSGSDKKGDWIVIR